MSKEKAYHLDVLSEMLHNERFTFTRGETNLVVETGKGKSIKLEACDDGSWDWYEQDERQCYYTHSDDVMDALDRV